MPNSITAYANGEHAKHRTGSVWRHDRELIALELCQCDMFDLIKAGGPLHDTQLLSTLFTQICLSVAALHQLGRCHMDLKLENVLLSQDCSVRLCDFGYAQLID